MYLPPVYPWIMSDEFTGRSSTEFVLLFGLKIHLVTEEWVHVSYAEQQNS